MSLTTCSSPGAATAHGSPRGRLSILVPIQSLQGEQWLSPAGLCVAVGSAGMSCSGCSEVGVFGAVVVLDARWHGNRRCARAHGVRREVGIGQAWHQNWVLLADWSRRILGKQGSNLGLGKLVLSSGSGGGCDSVNQGSAHFIPAVYWYHLKNVCLFSPGRNVFEMHNLISAVSRKQFRPFILFYF